MSAFIAAQISRARIWIRIQAWGHGFSYSYDCRDAGAAFQAGR